MKGDAIGVATVLLVSAFVFGSVNTGEVREVLKLQRHCTEDTLDERMNIATKCVDKVNVVSIIDPEGWLESCQKVAEDTVCPVRMFNVIQRCDRYFFKCFWEDESREVVEDE